MKKLIGGVLLGLAITAGCNTDIRTVKITESNKADIVQKILNNEAHLTDAETTAIKDYIAYKRMQSIGYGGTGKTSLPVGKTVGEAITLATQFQHTHAEQQRLMDEDLKLMHEMNNKNISDAEVNKKLKESEALLEKLKKVNAEMKKF